MPAKYSSMRAIATISILGGILVHLAILTVIRIQPPLRRMPHPEQAAVEYVGNLQSRQAPGILEQAVLLDSAPLFMPTRYNVASQMTEVASLKEATEIFEPFSAELLIPMAGPTLPQSLTQSTPVLEPSLPRGPAFTLSRLGRVRPAPQETRSPGPSVRIQPASGQPGITPHTALLPEDLMAQSPPALWSPVSIYIQLRGGIPVGIPLLAQSSGFAEWDEALQSFLGSLDFYRQLGDGYYRLSVFP